jgi:hypothetical protein
MVLDERSRHQLRAKLEQVLGADEAATLMEYLPPVGWADVATKTDLAVTAQALDLKLETLENRVIARMDEKLAEQSRHFVLAMVGANSALVVTVAGLAFAAARLF